MNADDRAPAGAVALVLAKTPVPGKVKTRLAVTVGDVAAARLAEAALLDTIDACAAAFGPRRCVLALAGPRPGPELLRALTGWTVLAQQGSGLARRIVHAHRAVHARTDAAVMQIGMDTPHVDPSCLAQVTTLMVRHRAPALGLAVDGGWWLLGSIGDHDLAGLERVPMSTATTGAATLAALSARGLEVQMAPTLRDVDEAADAQSVANAAPGTRFARLWRSYGRAVDAGGVG